MLYLLAHHFRDALERSGLGFLRVFNSDAFQAIAATLLSFALCVAAGPGVIRWLRHKKIGDHPEFDQAEINAQMAGKKGTPTMGGVLIIGAVLLSALLLADLQNFYVVMGLLCVTLFGAVGAVDDWLKLTQARRQGGRDGLTMGEKLLFQTAIALVLSGFLYYYGRRVPVATTFYVPFFKSAAVPLAMPVYLLVSTLVMAGASNGVNLTDGLDGLVAGIMAIVGIAFVVLALIIGDPALSHSLIYHYFPPAAQMGVFSGAIVGACLGFLWFNCYPAKVFMGDTGSLALGGLIGFIAVVVRQELMLALVGGVFVLETFSVLIQRYWFKYTRIRYGEGRRVFRMAPIHHHFQRLGWTETQVVVRFWLIAAILAATALATVKLR